MTTFLTLSLLVIPLGWLGYAVPDLIDTVIRWVRR